MHNYSSLSACSQWISRVDKHLHVVFMGMPANARTLFHHLKLSDKTTICAALFSLPSAKESIITIYQQKQVIMYHRY